MRKELPDHQWADLLAPADLRSGDLKAIRAHQTVGQTATMGEVDTTRDMLLTRIITAWSFELPLPKELPATEGEAGSLDRLPIPAYNALLTATEPYFALINGDEPDPKPSPESDGGLKGSPSNSATSSKN